MAQPIPLKIPPRNPRAELRSRLELAPILSATPHVDCAAGFSEESVEPLNSPPFTSSSATAVSATAPAHCHFLAGRSPVASTCVRLPLRSAASDDRSEN